MNRRQKIIVSVVGIFIVLLALVGITYGYFLTRIQGNTNTTSISVNTAKLELLYGDNSEEIIVGNGLLMPTVGTDEDDAVGTKTFTVTNNGNDSNYVVIIDNVNITKASDGTPTTFKYNTFRYKLSCSVKDKDGKTIENEKCNEVTSITVLPINGGILVGNAISENRVHEYTLTMWYIDNGEDQSDDMAKTYQARVNIADVNQMENPFKTGVTATDNTNLAYNIIKNAKETKNGTSLLNVSDTPVSSSISTYKVERTLNISNWQYGTEADINSNGSGGGTNATACTNEMKDSWLFDMENYEIYGPIVGCDNGKPVVQAYGNEYESSLVVEQDDLGTSYYYRGAVEDNYVTFADMCWRIVRINGDGSTKLILEDQDQPCSEDINGNWDIPTTTGGSTKTGNFGYTQYSSNTLTASDGTTKNSGIRYLMDYLHGKTNSASSMATAFKNFQSTFTATELSKLKAGNWCLNDRAYDSSNNLLNSTQIMDNKIKGTSFNYDSLVRLYNNPTKEPTLKCNGTIMNDWDDNETNPTPMYVGAITADEIVYAGGKVYENNPNYYLINNYLKSNYKYFWSLSPYEFGGDRDRAFRVYYSGHLDNIGVNGYISFRPSVSLASSAVITGGEGTLKKPYVIG